METPLRILLHCSACVIFIVGKFYIDLGIDWDISAFSISNNMYYVWEKLCFLLITLCVIYPCKIALPLFKPVAGLIFLRLIFEIPILRDWKWQDDNNLIDYVDAIAFIWLIIVIISHVSRLLKVVQAQLKKGMPKA